MLKYLHAAFVSTCCLGCVRCGNVECTLQSSGTVCIQTWQPCCYWFASLQITTLCLKNKGPGVVKISLNETCCLYDYRALCVERRYFVVKKMFVFKSSVAMLQQR